MFGRVVTKANEVKCQKWESGKVGNFDEAKELFLDAAKILRRRAESVEADVSGLSPRVLQFQRGNPWYANKYLGCVDKVRIRVCGDYKKLYLRVVKMSNLKTRGYDIYLYKKNTNPEVCGCRDNGVLRCKDTKYF